MPGENEQETVDFSLKADWDTDGIDVTAILSYSDLQEYLLSDGTSASFTAMKSPIHVWQIVQP